MLLSQELSGEGITEMVGKRLKVVWRPETGPTALEAGPVGGAGPTGLEVGPVGKAGLAEEEVEATGEAGPVELEVWPVRRQGSSWRIHPSASAKAVSSYPGSGERTSRDRRILLPSSEEGFRRVMRRPPATASSMSPSSNRRAL